MTDLETCPAEGCDYDGLPNSVCAHYSGKSDDAHEGGYERAQTLLDGPDDEQQSDELSSTEQQSEATPDSGNPTMGNADPDESSTDEIELPCEHESFDPDDVTEDHLVNGKLPVECDTCNETYWYE